MKFLPTSNLLLKNQTDLFEKNIQKKITYNYWLELVAVASVGLASFGAVMSLVTPDWVHAADIAWKMIVLVFGSVILCIPALYVFASIRGSRITLPQLLFLVSAAVATIAVVLVSLAPISGFFAWIGTDIDIMAAVNAAMIGLSFIFGIMLLARGFSALHRHYKITHSDHHAAVDILILWLLVVIVVTVQMSHKLAPWY